MLCDLFTNYWDYWELRHKVTFDPERKFIIVNEGVTQLDIHVDVYSDFKEWFKLGTNAQFLPAIRAVGGDLLPDLTPLGRSYFLINGWRIFLDHAVTIDGNIYSENFPSPYVVDSGVQLSAQKFSNLVDVAQADLSGVALAVWQKLFASGLTAEQQVLAALTVGKFIALK